MGTQIKNNSGAEPVRILVVSQTYRHFVGFENFGQDVADLEDLHSRKIERNGEEFRKKFIIEKFFRVRNRDFRDLINDISSGEYDIIHFSMHAHGGMVYFTENDLISYEQFISAFDDIHRTAVVILNICYSAGIAERISSKVPMVLGWEEKVTVDRAKDTSTSFYTPLFNGSPVSDCFSRLKENREANCKIFMDSDRLDNQRKQDRPDFNDDLINKTGSENQVVSDTKKPVRKIRTVFITLMALFIMVMTGIFLMKSRNIGSPGHESDSLQIISPVSGSGVVTGSKFVLSAKVRAGGTPWIFVLPPAGTVWWPQYEGHLKESGNWEFQVLAGNEADTGQFTMVAMVIKDQIAEEMKAWLASQGTSNQSDPLTSEILKSFFWYASDTVVVTRIIE